MERESQPKIIPIGAGVGRRVSSELRAYWETLRKGRGVPARSEVDPRGIERSLEFAFILERVAPGMGRFRLAGTHINDVMGMEVRGMPLSALFTPDGRKKISEITESVFAGPEIAEVDLRAQTGIGKPELEAKLLILPLASDLGDVTRAIGCLVAEGELGRTPRRFDVSARRLIEIGTDAQTHRPAPLQPEQLGFSESQATFAGPPRKKTPSEHFAEMTPDERRAMFREPPGTSRR